MANAVLINDVNGDVVDAEYYCSDTCAKSNKGYVGWYGCVELDFGQECSADGCSEKLHGVEECECGDQGCKTYSESQQDADAEPILCLFCKKREAEYLIGMGGNGLHGEYPACAGCVKRRGGTLPE